MKTSFGKFCVLPTIATLLFVGAHTGQGQLIFVDFEPTDPATYVANDDIVGIDSWIRYGGSGITGRVTPTTGGYPNIGPGTQSFVHLGNSTIYARPFTEQIYIDNGFTMSWLFWQETTNAATDNQVGLANTLSAVTPIGAIGVVRVDGIQYFKLVGDGAATVSGVVVPNTGVAAPTVFRLDMVFSITNQNFAGYATMVKNAGVDIPVQDQVTDFLGTKALGAALAAGLTQNTGVPSTTAPVFFSHKIGGHSFVIDNIIIAVIPEPGTAGLVLAAFGWLVLLRRRRESRP